MATGNQQAASIPIKCPPQLCEISSPAHITTMSGLPYHPQVSHPQFRPAPQTSYPPMSRTHPLEDAILTFIHVGKIPMTPSGREVPLFSCCEEEARGQLNFKDLSYRLFARMAGSLKLNISTSSQFAYIPPGLSVFRPIGDDASFQAAVMRMRHASLTDLVFYVVDTDGTSISSAVTRLTNSRELTCIQTCGNTPRT